MNKYKNVIVGVALVGLIAMSLFAYKVYSTFFSANTNFEAQTYEVFIPSTADYNAAFMLVADAVEDRDAFHETAVRKGYNSNVKPGHYILKKGMSNNDIINTIRSQNQPVKVRFNNQERLEDLAGRLAQQVEPDSLTLLKVMKDPAFLKENGFTEETALTMYLSNSYDCYWNTSAVKLRDKMLSAYKNFWNEDRLAKAKRSILHLKKYIHLPVLCKKKLLRLMNVLELLVYI
ncbi:YceG like protein [Nonlabens ulvanivorans]|nr:YceG like protein [Nonlabens ulvanivorans]